MNAPANIPTEATTTRHDGWTPDRRRTFLELLAEGHTVEAACAHVGKSRVTAYALRRRDPGFALAWSAAVLRARDTVADMLTSRAIDGQVDTLTRADGTTITRHRYDNRLGLALLARLDRLAAQPAVSDLGPPDEAAMRAAAHAFDALVDLVGQGDLDADAVAAFIEPQIRKLRKLCDPDRMRGREEDAEEAGDDEADEGDAVPKHPQTDELCKLHTASGNFPEEPHPSVAFGSSLPLPGEREGARTAEPSGKGEVLPSARPRRKRVSRELCKLRTDEPAYDPGADPPLDAETGRPRIWYREGYGQYHTDLPPPPDFRRYQHGRFGQEGYWRVLSLAELERQKERDPATPASSP